MAVRANVHRDSCGAREQSEAEDRVGRVLGVAGKRRRAAGGTLRVEAVPDYDLVFLLELDKTVSHVSRGW